MYNDFHNPPISPLPKHSLYDSYSPRNSSYSTTSISNTTDNGNSNNKVKSKSSNNSYEIKSLVKKDLYERYDKLALRKALQQMSDIRWCKNPK
ncbi:7149_t:CDS:2, partial [Entrophospora sp. SA101]